MLLSGFRGLCFAGAFLCLCVLSGCTEEKSEAAWYRFQGVNLTECGPAVAAAGSSFAGRERSVAAARETNDRLFWRLVDIYEYLLSQGVSASWASTDVIEWDALTGNELGIFYQGAHFFIYTNGKVYDPLFGIRASDGEAVVGNWFIRVRR